jgi:hypothetical protein
MAPRSTAAATRPDAERRPREALPRQCLQGQWDGWQRVQGQRYGSPLQGQRDGAEEHARPDAERRETVPRSTAAVTRPDAERRPREALPRQRI